MKRKPIRLKVRGKFKTFKRLSDATRYFKIPYAAAHMRLVIGWSMRKALTTPLRGRKANKYKPSRTMLRHLAGEAKHLSLAVH